MSSFGLSAGERRVVELALQGRSTKQMAAELVISPYTVQDRLKGVFEKVGVRSRRDLVARLSGAPA
jgi:DNA-binding CsgD family transcriptional regulator